MSSRNSDRPTPPERSRASVWLAVLGVPPLTAIAAGALALPGARRADLNWDGLMLSPGDVRILAAIGVGWIAGLLLVFGWLRLTRPRLSPR